MDHYRRLRKDPGLRERLMAGPAEGLKEHFGVAPDDRKCRTEVIPQDPDTIVILLPAIPTEQDPSSEFEAKAEAASSRIYDILLNRSGVGSFFIPSTDMTWVLRDFRSKVAAKFF